MNWILRTAILIICTFLMITGCRKKSDSIDISSQHTTAAVKETMTPSKEPSVTTAAKTPRETTAAKETTSASRPSSTKATKEVPTISADINSYTTGSISVQYPKISGLDDSAKEVSINKLLMDNALSVISAYSLNTEQDTAAIRCQLVQTDRKLIAAVYTGTVSLTGSPYPVNVFFTNTIDVGKGVDVGFDRFADSHSMAAYILSPDCEFVDVSADLQTSIREYLATQTVDYFADIFDSADFPIKASTSEGNPVFPQSFSYAKQGNIYFSLPLPHPLGDYVLVKFVPETK